MLLNKIKTSDIFQQIFSALKQEAQFLRINGLNRGAKSFLIPSLHKALGKNIVYIVSSEEEKDALRNNLSFFLPFSQLHDTSLIRFPSLGWEPYQPISPHSETQRLRMEALWKLTQSKNFILLVSIEALMLPVISKEAFSYYTHKIKLGDEIPYSQLFEYLDIVGYRRADMVEEVGDYAVRGGIVDLFSPQSDYPIRLEYFGDTIESIRTFDPITQRSLQKLELINIVPFKEIIISKKDLPVWIKQIKQRWPGSEYKGEIRKRTEEIQEKLSLPDIYYFAPLVKGCTGNLLEYVHDTLFVLDEPHLIEQRIERLKHTYQIRYQEISAKGKVGLKPEEIINNKEHLFQTIDAADRIDLHELNQLESYPKGKTFSVECRSFIRLRGNIPKLIDEIKKLRKDNTVILLQMNTGGQAKRLSEIFAEYQLPATLLESGVKDSVISEDNHIISSYVAITNGKAKDSFYLASEKIAFITEESIFGPITEHKQLRKGKVSNYIDRFRDIKRSDYVVHVDHGIGINRGLKQLKVEGMIGDFIEIEYQNRDKLYLPIDRLDQIYKYSSSEGLVPVLNKLGGTSWTKVKQRVKKGVKDLTRELLNLYGTRMAIKGNAFNPDNPWQKEFEDSFEYEETPDQYEAVAEIKSDMESDKPMDRLLCGDVGYGKTEVAMRAAFKAAMDGKQVAMLAPTTVLVFQHYNTFKERFRFFPIKIEMLSRFRSKREQKEILPQLKNCAIDVIIGTHRLLSDDVHFGKLGLLIIDEEQRFGVSHKEKIKQLKKQVDVLTMTATPIPRTLNMAISGVRDLSLIQTPPENRLSIHTYLIGFDADIIRSAILQELRRGGQVYFVHNRIENIDSVAVFIKRICPEVRLGITHGRMPEKKLENEVLKFMNKEYNVLLTTAIIENGLDIPSTNTIIINRADRFGLAQLYQLRGRVGRSEQRAYAYLVVPPESSLSAEARKRLKAIKEFTELGSGFRLAAWDLEIRGAGNLLGAEQHGRIAAVGFDMYCRMLEDVARELKGEPLEEEFRSTINLGLDIYIPDAYIPDSNIKLMLYRQISSIREESEIDALEEELRDRYGRLPESVENMLSYLKLKLLAEELKIKKIERKGKVLRIKFSHDSKISADKIVQFVADKGVHFSSEGVLHIAIKDKNRFLLRSIEKLLQEIC